MPPWDKYAAPAAGSPPVGPWAKYGGDAPAAAAEARLATVTAFAAELAACFAASYDDDFWTSPYSHAVPYMVTMTV